ncbi:hypothetical protein SS50377_24375 [Spironucleus salmonicida]|uniref:Uncharacterized protein n=1 Tax=Spironucleus salmonicida TaxID=348837 RepID=V6LN69_9EUKA|nr:hypothetical protein SS50377_24375 [Spironucleus salmonicida]|eukprot:EST46075.1 Hypothetical protein SS50377_14065 [Spironucleus salmonicida]
MLSNFQDELNNDLEYQQLLDDCLGELSQQFTQFQHASIPVIQENYIARNEALSRCYTQLSSYKQKLAFAQKQVQTASVQFQRDACARAIYIGNEYAERFQKERDRRQAVLDKLRDDEAYILKQASRFRHLLEVHRERLGQNPLWQQGFNRKGLDFYERTKGIEARLGTLDLNDVENQCSKYVQSHKILVAEIERMKETRNNESRANSSMDLDLDTGYQIAEHYLNLQPGQTLGDLVDAEYRQNESQQLRAVEDDPEPEEDAVLVDFE